LPDDAVLAASASALNKAGYWAQLLDASWRLVYFTDELMLSWSSVGATAVPIGYHYFSPEAVEFRRTVVGGIHAVRESYRAIFENFGPYVLASTPGGRDELRRIVDPDLADLVDTLQPRDVPVMWVVRPRWTLEEAAVGGSVLCIRIDDGRGQQAGLCMLAKPAAGMSQISNAVAAADLAHLERMRIVGQPDRRAAAILMADLAASSPLARRRSTAQYFGLGRNLVLAADQCVIDLGGIVGRHAGDGVVAFFLAETAGSESAAARSCIAAARFLRGDLANIAARSEIPPSELSLRFGLHWGATLYIGRILTPGRSEVTALGEEVNETARIEACATAGRILASKMLIERLNYPDADALRIDTHHTSYTPLADLPTATDKARRDAPSVAVCEI
jgi:class 3 adenylate cyclase